MRAAQDSRIKVIPQPHRGLVESLQRGFQEATGRYIARMDADDISVIDRFERQARFLESNAEIAVVGGAIEALNAESRRAYIKNYPTDPDSVRLQMRLSGCVVSHPTVLMRRSVLAGSDGYRKAYRHAEDYDLWLRILEKADITNLPEVVLGYRRHEESVSYVHASQQAISSLCARRTAQLRLEGQNDPTLGISLVTENVLLSLGVSPDEIRHAVFTHLAAVTADVVRSGAPWVTASFFHAAAPYASKEQVRSAGLKLNRLALSQKVGPVQRRKHRVQLLSAAPDVYWELFGACAPADLHGNGDDSEHLSEHHSSSPVGNFYNAERLLALKKAPIV
jgi:hypothetical protein